MQQANSTASIAEFIGSEMDKDDSSLQTQNEETPPETDVAKTTEVAPTEPVVTPEEESFTPFNPNDLTPEMLKVYKGWQADYTKTRQREKAELQEYKDKLTKFEQSPSGTQTEKVNDFNNAKANGEIDPNMSFQDYSRLLIDKAKEEFKSEFKTDQENEYLGNQEKEFLNIDPRFQEGPGLDKVLLNHVASELSILRNTYEEENGTIIGFDFIGQAKELIAGYDSRISESNQAFIKKQNELAKAKTLQSQKVNPNSRNTTGTPNGTMSIRDAIGKSFEVN